MSGNDATSIEMPRYKCHKEVHALKIGEIDSHPDGSVTITPDDKRYAPFVVDAQFVFKHQPWPGGYYVVYADGYKSFSPGPAFEEGYVRVGYAEQSGLDREFKEEEKP